MAVAENSTDRVRAQSVGLLVVAGVLPELTVGRSVAPHTIAHSSHPHTAILRLVDCENPVVACLWHVFIGGRAFCASVERIAKPHPLIAATVHEIGIHGICTRISLKQQVVAEVLVDFHQAELVERSHNITSTRG